MSIDQRVKDIASSEADLRQVWLLLGMSPQTIERAMQVVSTHPSHPPSIVPEGEQLQSSAPPKVASAPPGNTRARSEQRRARPGKAPTTKKKSQRSEPSGKRGIKL